MKNYQWARPEPVRSCPSDVSFNLLLAKYARNPDGMYFLRLEYKKIIRAIQIIADWSVRSEQTV